MSSVPRRNSWSRYWGDKGYVHISRDHHGCGIATDAIYAIVDTDALEAEGNVTAQQ